MAIEKLPPIHPGEILRDEFMERPGLSQSALARALGVSPRRINQIVNEQRAITADTAHRLARFIEMSPEFWMGLQTDYDLETAEDELGSRLDHEVKSKADVLT